MMMIAASVPCRSCLRTLQHVLFRRTFHCSLIARSNTEKDCQSKEKKKHHDDDDKAIEQLSSFQLPLPTWSLRDLKLSSKDVSIVSDEDLQRWTRQSNLDLSQIAPQEQQRLRQDLASMLHMIQTIQSVNVAENLTDIDLYDVPRGLADTPKRPSLADKDAERLDEEAKQVYDSILKPKTTRIGGHEYFAIVTKTTKK